MLARAADEARRLRHSWIGPEHYLLAVLAEPSTATEVMAGLGVTHSRLSEHLRALKVNGRRPRYSPSQWIGPNPSAHHMSGWARGFAAAAGDRTPTPEQWLVAIFYDEDSMAVQAVHQLGVAAADVVDGLRGRGLTVPPFEPAAVRPWRGHREIEVARSEWQAVVDVLSRTHPPGSDLRWGFNSKRSRPGRVQFMAEEGIDLDAIVAEARSGQVKRSGAAEREE